jgi:hypothetical protein
MDETQDLAARASRDLLDDPERTDWDELLAANRALIKVIESGEPMTQRDARISPGGPVASGCGGVAQGGQQRRGRRLWSSPEVARPRLRATKNSA